MIKIYGLTFYMFLKLSRRLETVWGRKTSMPLYTANILFSICVLFIGAIIILPFTNRENSNSLGLLPMIFGILIFVLNYNLLIKNNRILVDEKEFDLAKGNIKSMRVILFYCLLMVIIVSFFLVSKSIIFRTDSEIYFNSKKVILKQGAGDIIKIMGYPEERYLSPNSQNDSVYYYSFNYKSIKGVEFYFNKKTKTITRIFYFD